MNVMKLITHWDADQANTVIELLDELRDVIWATYGNEIIEMRKAAAKEGSIDSEINDDMTF